MILSNVISVICIVESCAYILDTSHELQNYVLMPLHEKVSYRGVGALWCCASFSDGGLPMTQTNTCLSFAYSIVTKKRLSLCHLTQQRLINALADGVHERHCRHDDALLDYRPTFRVFTDNTLDIF